MPEWTPGGDPMLALLPPELPMMFQQLMGYNGPVVSP